ncbi:MAG: dTDP-4-dehydrorhamnose 3,5-epimerase family protein [Candidatus Eisenbacteria bacterium]
MIEGVVIKTLRVVPDERGFLMEILRSDDPFFERFGQVYLSVAYPGVVKGWHYHRLQTDHMTVVSGMAKIVLYDRREDSATHNELMELFAGERNPILIRIPPGVCHGMKAVGPAPALMINTPDRVYDYEHPDEYRIAAHGTEIPYDWSRRDG